MRKTLPQFTDQLILALRPDRHQLSAKQPYAYFIEQEYQANGIVADVATVFLTNRECPYRCLMCDLWKNTLTESVSPGDIPLQIDWALNRLPNANVIKLYNSGNFFDPKAVPTADYPMIAERVRNFDTVIVENHPRLCNEQCTRFRDLIAPAQLEIALGLETHLPEYLKMLNKRMTRGDFESALKFLHDNQVSSRVFLLLKLPYMNDLQALDSCLQALEYCFDLGVSCCAVIPTRVGNGVMDRLQQEGHFSPPAGPTLEAALKQGLELKRGRVLLDLWDAQQFFPCSICREERIARLKSMNLTQQLETDIICRACSR